MCPPYDVLALSATTDGHVANSSSSQVCAHIHVAVQVLILWAGATQTAVGL